MPNEPSESAFPIETPHATDGRTHDGGISIHDYFMAHAPPMPAKLLEGYLEVSRISDPDFWDTPIWSDQHFDRIAFVEARWRRQYAKNMMKVREL